MVKFQPSKLAMRVRFPLPARCLMLIQRGTAVARTSIAGQKVRADTAFSNKKTIALMERRLYARTLRIKSRENGDASASTV
jgi:hypothetical protein